MDKYNQTLHFYQTNAPQTLAEFEQFFDNFRILFAYNSGKIENDAVTYHDTREIFENGKVLNYTGDPRTIFELENQKWAYDYLKTKIISKKPLTIALIKEIHQILTAGTFDSHRFMDNGERPGEFKKHDYVTGINEAGSRPAEVEADLLDLLKEINDPEAQADRLKAATYFHARFENIHPFADGNGRVGRTLLNYYLMIHDNPPLIVYDEDKKYYYAGLAKFDEENEINSLYEFLKYQTEKTWEKTLKRQ